MRHSAILTVEARLLHTSLCYRLVCYVVNPERTAPVTGSPDLRSIERRPTKYWDIDGLPELVMGAMWIVWGGAMLLGQRLPRGAVWNAYWTCVPAFLALSGIGVTWAIKQLKGRITFPRTGYVAWKGPTQAVRFTAAGTALVTAVVLVLLVTRSRERGIDQVVAPGLGVLLSLAFVVAGVRQRAPHMLLLAGVALALGLAFGALATGWDAANWLLVGLGAAAVLIGAIRLRAFLRQHPLGAHA